MNGQHDFFNVESVIQITPITVRMTSTKKKDRKFNVTRGKSSNWILRLSGGIQTMGLKNDIKFKILQELMQETNIERPISIWKLRDAVYGEISVEGDKEKKKNKRDNQIRTVKRMSLNWKRKASLRSPRWMRMER